MSEEGAIYRRVLGEERVEIPEGKERCPYCKGKGYSSAYDRGWRSLVHDPELAAEEPCFVCGTTGLIDVVPRSGGVAE